MMASQGELSNSVGAIGLASETQAAASSWVMPAFHGLDTGNLKLLRIGLDLSSIYSSPLPAFLPVASAARMMGSARTLSAPET
jgi:hypothetical protein